jgi:hypothetical protein
VRRLPRADEPHRLHPRGLRRPRPRAQRGDDLRGRRLGAATLPLDTAAVTRIDPDDGAEVADGIELSARVAESREARECFARHYFRFTFARPENDEVDGCEIQTIRDALGAGRSLREVLRDVAMSPTFRTRKLTDGVAQ